MPISNAGIVGKFYDVGGQVLNAKHPDYGAVGDGVTDDTQALLDLITDSAVAGIPGFVPAGNYAISQALRGIEGATLIFDIQSTLIPTADVNVLEIVRGFRVHRPHIDVSSFSGYSKNAIYVDGITVAINIGQDQALIEMPWIEGNQEGTGIHVDADADSGTSAKVEWLHIERPRIRQMHTAIKLEGDEVAYTGAGRYVHTVNIQGPQMSGCTRYIDIIGNSGGHNISDIAIQCSIVAESVIYCEGGGNWMSGRIWDLQLATVDQPIVFTETSQSNICFFPTTIAFRMIDKGISNWIVTSDNSKAPMMITGLPGAGILHGAYGDQDDALAWADQDYTVSQTAGDVPTSGTFDSDKADLFNLTRSSNYITWAASSNSQVVEIDYGGSQSSWQQIGVYFGTNNPAPQVTIEADLDGAGDWVTLQATTANTGRLVTAYHGHVDAGTLYKHRITLTSTADQIQLDRIWGYRSEHQGKAWQPARGALTSLTIGSNGTAITEERKYTREWNPGSVAAGAALSVNFTANGAVLGDVVTGKSFSESLQGMILDVTISATTQATFTLFNPTTAALNIGSSTSTVTYWVRKG